MMVSAPPFLNPCYYGTDIDSRDSLIAVNHTVDEIAKIIGVDSLGYLSVDSVTKIAACPGSRIGEGFCTACFSGNYPTEVPSEPQKNRFEQKLSESRRADNEN